MHCKNKRAIPVYDQHQKVVQVFVQIRHPCMVSKPLTPATGAMATQSGVKLTPPLVFFSHRCTDIIIPIDDIIIIICGQIGFQRAP